MSKSVLISIRPKWCEKIASGKKTIEVRKTRPKIETPFKCYIYCTQNELLVRSRDTRVIFRGGSLGHRDDQVLCGHVIGEFVCESINEFVLIKPLKGAVDQNPKISSENGLFDIINIQMITKLTLPELIEYMGWHKSAYAWKISDLVIYDKPKELTEFRTPGYRTGYKIVNDNKRCVVSVPFNCENEPLQRPPQSWCYVEEVT